MSTVTVFHNPNCSTSRAATDAAAELGVPVEIRRYQLKAQRPTVDELRELLGMLEDEPTALVRRDATFARLGLDEADVQTADQVAQVLAAHPDLIQRPVLIADGAAIIGRPKERVAPFLEAHRSR
jgi:arsenate reductase (glutaredoxin)